MLIKWSLVVNFLTYRSDLCLRDAFEIVEGFIREISCPKTEVPKKCVVLSIVVYVRAKTKLLKKRTEDLKVFRLS